MTLSTWDIILRLGLAAVVGAIVGLEREANGRPAGLRTHALVAVGAALFTTAGAYGFSDIVRADTDPARVAAQVAAGVGFIGAGAVLRHGGAVLGITTAATIWVSAALGVAAGAGAYVAVTTAVVLSLLLLAAARVSRSLSTRFGATTTIVDIEYERGHGTLGPLIRGLEGFDGRVESLSIEDDDDASGSHGRRHVVLRVFGRPNAAFRSSLEELAERDEVHALTMN